MPGSLLLPVVSAVAGKAGDALVKSVTRMWGVDDDRDKLERHLEAVKRKLSDAEEKSETNPTIKRWMKDLRDVAYEADDVLDDFQYEALRREAQNQIGESTTRKVLSYFTRHSPLLFRFTVSRNLNNVLKKINDLVEEMNKFRLEEAPQVLYRQTHSALDLSSDIFGRDDDKEVVVKLLLDQQDQKSPHVHVLPIIGMGGLGKTTLAKMVYNDHRVQNHFQLKMWHCVSDNFDACPLVKSIIELVTKDKCNLPDTIELLRGRLQEAIGRRRYLLILDDVWNEEQRKWEEDLKPLLSSIGGPGSFIIVTSRSQRVASIMGTVRPHELACLSEDDSWKLFSKKAFSNGVQEQAQLVTTGRRIVKKCRGLPLALKTMGGLMSSKQQVQEWEAIEQSNIGDNVRGKEEIMSILKLSYRHLSSEMKQCFAFCAIFPKDCEMGKDELIQLWMANGFIQEERTMDLAQKGESIFHNLVWRSFLQDVKAKTYYSPFTTYESIGCKMHDLMHDLAKDVTDECATIEELIQQKASIKDVRHMQMSIAELEQINGVLKGRPSLRTLLEKVTSHKDLKELKLVSIRVLRCYSFSIINSLVVNAKHLRYLDLSWSGIVRLPNSICMLYNLQSLRLNDCRNLKYLPEDMRTMRKLIHLYLFGCDSLKRMPPRIGLLKSLRTLTTFVVDTEDGHGVEELKDLQLLGGRLELWNLKAIRSGSNAGEANLHLKQNVNDLLLHWGHDRFECRPRDVVADKKEVIEFPLPPSRLKSLQVCGNGRIEISSWVKEPHIFLCLKELRMSDCWRCKDLPPLWQSLSLESLSLSRLDNLTTLSSGIGMVVQGCNGSLTIFPKLKKMSLQKLPNLEKWMDNGRSESITSVMFPELKVLRIDNCPKLVNIPKAPILQELDIINHCKIAVNSVSHLTELSQLKYFGGGCDPMDVQVIPFSSWPSLVELHLGWLGNLILPEEQQRMAPLESIRKLWIMYSNCFFSPNLSKWSFGFWECFAFVENLVIVGCDDLVHWPVKEFCSLNCLRFLEVSHCKNLIGSSSVESLLSPQLEVLTISFCNRLSDIPRLPESLESLFIQHCACLISLPSNVASLARLVNLKLLGCEGLRKLPDGMDGLTALQELWIRQCPGIETLPQDFLQRLPTLRKLMTLGSPKLGRRCRRGGEYWEFVSNIPYLNRDVVEEGSTKGFAKRFLPCCSILN